MVQRAVFDGLRVIEPADGPVGRVDRVARPCRCRPMRGPFHAEVPFAEAGGPVALGLEQAGEGESIRGD